MKRGTEKDKVIRPSKLIVYCHMILSFWSLEEKMNREGKGGGYLEKEFFFAEEK